MMKPCFIWIAPTVMKDVVKFQKLFRVLSPGEQKLNKVNYIAVLLEWHNGIKKIKPIT